MKPSFDQQLNLLKLAKGLAALPENYEHFHMGFYLYCDDDNLADIPENATKANINQCGVVACAAGHAPSMTKLKVNEGEDWLKYVERVFGLYWGDVNGAYCYLFNGRWASIDNTPLGAAKRIVRFIENECCIPRIPKGQDFWNAEK